MVANWWIIISFMCHLGMFNEKKELQYVINSFMVLHYSSYIYQEFNDSSNFLAHSGAYHTIPHGELYRYMYINIRTCTIFI